MQGSAGGAIRAEVTQKEPPGRRGTAGGTTYWSEGREACFWKNVVRFHQTVLRGKYQGLEKIPGDLRVAHGYFSLLTCVALMISGYVCDFSRGSDGKNHWPESECRL